MNYQLIYQTIFIVYNLYIYNILVNNKEINHLHKGFNHLLAEQMDSKYSKTRYSSNEVHMDIFTLNLSMPMHMPFFQNIVSCYSIFSNLSSLQIKISWIGMHTFRLLCSSHYLHQLQYIIVFLYKLCNIYSYRHHYNYIACESYMHIME